MKDIRYLLSIKELLEDGADGTLAKAAYEKLDGERQRKLEKITNERKRAESIGAGLLLQLAVQKLSALGEEKIAEEERGNVPVKEMDAAKDVCLFSVTELLSKLHHPIETDYGYSEKGKPYFKNFPWHFNLSHSEEYVFLVASKEEVGVDIQQKKSFYNERILRRFFTKEEQALWEAYEVPEEKEDFFWRMWIRKEAYGKLTGEGIAKAVSVNVTEPVEIEKLGVLWEHYSLIPNYYIAVCKWAEKESND